MENENPPDVPADLNELQSQFDSLRRQIFVILVLLIVVSGTMNIFLLRQWRYASNDARTLKEQSAPIFAEYQKVSGPRIDEFVKRVTEYGWSHPDFRPITLKYSLSTSGPPATAVPPRK
jgi:hypothetical protein